MSMTKQICSSHGYRRPALALSTEFDLRLRIVAAFGFALLAVAVNRPVAVSAVLTVALIATAIARIPMRKIGDALAALDGSMLFVIVLLPLTTPGEPIATILGTPVSGEGLTKAIQIAVKANAVALIALALLGSAELVSVGQALQRLGAPPKLTALMLMTVRYIDVLSREFRRLRVAMTVRGFQMRFDVHSWRSMGYLFGMLFVRSFDRAERIHSAMKCRGFDGVFPPVLEHALGARDAVFAGAAASTALVVGALEFV